MSFLAACRTIVFVAVIAVLVAACGGERDESDATYQPETRPAPTTTAPQPAPTVETEELLAAIRELAGSHYQLQEVDAGGMRTIRPAHPLEREQWMVVVYRPEHGAPVREDFWYKDADVVTKVYAYTEAETERELLALFNLDAEIYRRDFSFAMQRLLAAAGER